MVVSAVMKWLELPLVVTWNSPGYLALYVRLVSSGSLPSGTQANTGPLVPLAQVLVLPRNLAIYVPLYTHDFLLVFAMRDVSI